MTYEEVINKLKRGEKMTNEEVLNRLKSWVKEHDDYLTCKAMKDAIEIAIEAIEKQIPQKPNLKREQTSPFGVDDVPYCPTCNCSVPWIETSVFYCENCGQAIDWGESE